MTYKEAAKAALSELALKIGEYGQSVADRTISEQFNITKNASDFVGFLTNIAFLATVQSFINIELNKANYLEMIPLLAVGVFFLLVQLYFSISLSQTIYKITIRLYENYINILDPDIKKSSRVIFVIILVTQVVYYFMVRYITRMVEAHLG